MGKNVLNEKSPEGGRKVVSEKGKVISDLKANQRFDELLIKKLKKIISKYTDRPELLNGIENISNDTDINFIKNLNIDSLDVVEIVVDIEDEFNIVIEDEELKAFKSFGDMYDLIEKKLKLVDLGIK
ncbi:acyl carrier protein [Dyadobacter sp. CY312]|uniref:acyl carrier protein n=1 Tax=Dyadobacter sp. CY312 TaxID=2907303 RepID=UPI001F2E5EBE|nr:acyl carrier protein [Dyadobacter sp. CY312]MCE7044569.1 acyl carrier protein [Dyadobacter sp. CY312]